LEHIKELGYLRDDFPIQLAVGVDPHNSPGLLDRQYLLKEKAIRQLLEHKNICSFFTKLFGSKAKCVHYKWMRAIPRGISTGVHIDRAYLGKGSQLTHTCWIPLGDIPMKQGTLIVCKGSHTHPGLEHLRKNQDDNGVYAGWLSQDPNFIFDEVKKKEAESSTQNSKQHEETDNKRVEPETEQKEKTTELSWVGTHFSAGDVVILGMDVFHMSTTNSTNKYRLSCDTRWLPKDHHPDPRVTSFHHYILFSRIYDQLTSSDDDDSD